jgi:hypothetical protein
MAIDIRSEDLLSLTEAVRRLPGRPHISTLHRWRMRGVGGFRLETVKIGGRRFTSAEAIERFARRVTDASSPAIDDQAKARPSRSFYNAERELDRENV